MKKKILSILLSIAIMITMVPAIALAEETISDVDAKVQLDFENKEAFLLSTGVNYTLGDAVTIYAVKDVEDTPTVIYSWNFTTNKWLPSEGEEVEVIEDDIYYFVWEISLNPPTGDVFATNMTSVKVNSTDFSPLGEASFGVSKYKLSDDNLNLFVKQDCPANNLSSGEIDVVVGKEFDVNHIDADKVYCVTFEYNLPTTLSAGVNQKYIWDTENGKYVEGEVTQTSTENNIELTDGSFDFTITNKSNVDVYYEIDYTPDDEAIVISSLDTVTNKNGFIKTIAQGQQILSNPGEGVSPIEITDSDTAKTTDPEGFNDKTCSGTLKVTGYKEGKTVKDITNENKLGAFTITIDEINVKPVGGFVFYYDTTVDNGLTYTLFDANGAVVDVNTNLGDAKYYYVTGTKTAGSSELNNDKVYVAALDPNKDEPTAYTDIQSDGVSYQGSYLTSHDFGKGKYNNSFILQKISNPKFYKTVNELTLEGYDDWYVGTVEEVKKLAEASRNGKITVNFSNTGLWTSSINDQSTYRVRADGTTFQTSLPAPVCPIRSF